MSARANVVAISLAFLPLVVLFIKRAFTTQKDVIETHETVLKLASGFVLALITVVLTLTLSLSAIIIRGDWFGGSVFASLSVLAPIAYFRIFPYFVRKNGLRPAHEVGGLEAILDQVQSLAARMGISKIPEAYVSTISGPAPFVFGTLRKSALVLPANLGPIVMQISKNTKTDATSFMEFILLHELSHVKHKDFRLLCWGFIFIDLVVKYWLPLYAVYLLVFLFRIRFAPVPSPVFNLLVLICLLAFYLILISANREREILADARAALFCPQHILAAITADKKIFGELVAPPLLYALTQFSVGYSGALPMGFASTANRAAKWLGRVFHQLRGDANSFRVSGLLSTYPSDDNRVKHLRGDAFMESATFVPSTENSIWMGLCAGYCLLGGAGLYAVGQKWKPLAGLEFLLGTCLIFYLALFFFAPINNSLRQLPPPKVVISQLGEKMFISYMTATLFLMALLTLSRTISGGRAFLGIGFWIFGWFFLAFLLLLTLVLASRVRSTTEVLFQGEKKQAYPLGIVMMVPVLLLTVLAVRISDLLVGLSGVVIGTIATLRCFVSRLCVKHLAIGWHSIGISIGHRTSTFEFSQLPILFHFCSGLCIGLCTLAASAFLRFLVTPTQMRSRTAVVVWSLFLFAGALWGIVTGTSRGGAIAITRLRRVFNLLRLARLLGLSLSSPVVQALSNEITQLRINLVDRCMAKMEAIYLYLRCLAALSKDLPAGWIQWIEDCQGEEGGYGPWPGARPTLRSTSEAIQILSGHGRQSQSLLHVNWILTLWTKEGGFREAFSQDSDLEDTHLAIAALTQLGELSALDHEKCATWVVRAWRGSAKRYDLTYYAFESLRMLEALNSQVVVEFANWINCLYHDIPRLRLDQNSARALYLATMILAMDEYKQLLFPDVVEGVKLKMRESLDKLLLQQSTGQR